MEKHLDGSFGLKAFKQKLFVDGLCFLLQEIYGVENKNLEGKVSNYYEYLLSGAEKYGMGAKKGFFCFF